MRARYQLNAFYLCGCLLAAIAVGLMLQSWLGFAAALSVVVAMKMHDGGIRLTQQKIAARHGARRPSSNSNRGRHRF